MESKVFFGKFYFFSLDLVYFMNNISSESLFYYTIYILFLEERVIKLLLYQIPEEEKDLGEYEVAGWKR